MLKIEITGSDSGTLEYVELIKWGVHDTIKLSFDEYEQLRIVCQSLIEGGKIGLHKFKSISGERNPERDAVHFEVFTPKHYCTKKHIFSLPEISVLILSQC